MKRRVVTQTVIFQGAQDRYRNNWVEYHLREKTDKNARNRAISARGIHG